MCDSLSVCVCSGATAAESWGDLSSKESSVSSSSLSLTLPCMINDLHPCMINKVSAHALMQPRMKGQRSAQCAMEEGECDGLQIDLGLCSRPELTAAGCAGAAEGSAGMTWLQAAEHVLREDGGPGMHIRDLTRTILELGIVRDVFPLSSSSTNRIVVSLAWAFCRNALPLAPVHKPVPRWLSGV